FPSLRRGGACPSHLLSFGGSGAYPGNATLPSAFDCPISFSRSLFASGGLRSPKVDLLSSRDHRHENTRLPLDRGPSCSLKRPEHHRPIQVGVATPAPSARVRNGASATRRHGRPGDS